MTPTDPRIGLAVSGWPIVALINDDATGDWLLQRDPDTADTDSSILRLSKVGMDAHRARYTLIWTGHVIAENSTSAELKADRPSLFDAVMQSMRATHTG